MITKVLHASLLLCAGFLMATPLQERLEKAITESDAISVERYVQELSKEQRKETQSLVTRVVPLADEVYSMRNSQKSLYNDTPDLTRVSIGSLMISFSAFYLTLFAHEHYEAKVFLPHCLQCALRESAALLGTLGGGYLVYKGLSCSSQSKLVEQACQIKKLLKEELTER